ncbi:JNK-interacting protein 3-like protein, partial [Leptotrombidium deliense]
MDSETVTNALKDASLTSESGILSSNIETVYELPHKIGGALDSPTSHVVSERVQNLASQIYNELKRIINRCGDDEEVVSGLMPLVVNVFESLDLAIIENQQLQVELELCKDDNEQLVNAFDKEKTNKKKIEAKLFEYEFQSEEEKQQYQQKVDSLESIVKILELKSKNSSDHASRLEEKETEVKTEYNKLHTRYNELLRSHCDLMERMKILMGNDDATSLSGPLSLSSNINFKSLLNKRNELDSLSTVAEPPSDILHKNEPTSPMHKHAWDQDLSLEDASIIEDVEEIPRDKESHGFTAGMEKEVENLILENNELLATKNALNIVKDDLIAKVDELQSDLTMAKDETQQLAAVKNKLKSRIQALEEEIKKCKEELEEAKQKIANLAEDDEEGIPMAQRKRFTRVEMARVLMERNQYKERLIELQDAVRWTELIRQSKNEGEKKSAIWKFFSNLFSTSSSSPATTKESPTKAGGTGTAAVRYSATNPSTVTPALDAMRKRARAQQTAGPGADLVLLMDSDLSSERARALKNVRAHVNRANGDRIQAYGWSISCNQNENQSDNALAKKLKTTSVPVPIYCRPLTGDDIGMKIWCAAAVDLSGGEAGFPGGAESESKTENAEPKSISDTAIADLESELNQALAEQCDTANETKLSTFVWICSVSHSRSKVTIVNIRSNPSEVLDSFLVKTHLLCVSSVPGAKVNDIQGSEYVDLKSNEIKLMKPDSPKSSAITSDSRPKSVEIAKEVTEDKELEESNEIKNETLEKLSEYVAYTEPPSPSAHDSVSTPNSPVYQSMSTCLPTMWLGGQNGVLYVHSSIAQWSHCIASVKLVDSILQIIHFRGRVFIALANGQLCIFMRSVKTGEWNFSNYMNIDIGAASVLFPDIIGRPSSGSQPSTPGSSVASYSIRCLEVTKASIWLAYRNLIFIVDPLSLKIVHNFSVHPRKETQVRQLAAMGDGVWCSLRLDSTLRLYSSIKPYNHLQDVDIEPYVSKMLSPKAFTFIRITALKASASRLWIGTANGVILSIPCDKSSAAKDAQTLLASNETGKIAVKTFIPRCNATSAQLSFHGHKDAVKFFVCTKNLILSG